MKAPQLGVCAAGLAVALVGTMGAAAAPHRIASAIDPSRTGALRGAIHPLVHRSVDLGRMDADARLDNVSVYFKPSPQQQAELQSLLQAQQTAGSPQWHRWLTPQQFGERFGLGDADLQRVRQWLQSQGLSVTGVSQSRTRLTVSGSVAQFERAFGVEMHRFQYQGATHFASLAGPRLPAALDGIVQNIRNLDDFRLPPRRLTRRLAPAFGPTPQFTDPGDSSTHYLAPDDVATIYDIQPLYQGGIDGTGMKLAVVGQTAVDFTDIDAFRAAAGLTANDPLAVLVPNTGTSATSTDPSDLIESDVDLEWSGAIASKATVNFVYTGDDPNYDVRDALVYAIDTNIAPIVSMSYGSCEADLSATDLATFQSLGDQANAQGQTIIAASGDSGAAGCDAHDSPNDVAASGGLEVEFPAALSEVTGVGGTQFSGDVNTPATYWLTSNNSKGGSARKYIPETVWSDNTPSGLDAGGGGASKLVDKPVWQIGASVPADGHRDVPDLALNAAFAHDGYLYCFEGLCTNGFADDNGAYSIAGGTSFSAPIFAGILALVEQSNGSTGEGNLNPRLYQFSFDAATYASVFHDITTGDNKVPCTSGTPDCPAGTTSIGYAAGPGYDLATGLGSIDANELAQRLGASPLIGTTATLTISPNRVQTGSWVTLTLALKSQKTGTQPLVGSVQFALDGVNIGSPVNVVNQQATLKITLYDLGIHTLSALYSGTSDYAPAQASASASVLAVPPEQDSKDGGGGAMPPVLLSLMTLLAGWRWLRRRQ